ncbi:MAG TPA: hypothetical protein VMJ75_14680 [Candidatus Acidoferrales bacterium]|nr:hypothetical protein [Candidatus Acidoferrales bacterium]
MKYSTLCCVLLMAACAEAAVVDSSANGFTLKITLHIQAPPAAVYQKFVRNVGDWWNPAHTFSGSARNLSIEERAMGCFCEKLADGGGVRHMEVVYLAPGKVLVMTGALGPMQPLAAAGNLRVTFAAEEGGTKFEATYAVVGYLANGMNSFASPADNMLSEQFTRLKSYIESAAK